MYCEGTAITTIFVPNTESLIEVKLSQATLHAPLHYFAERLKPKQALQLVHNKNLSSRTIDKIQICEAAPWLGELEL